MRTLQSELIRNGLLQACSSVVDQKSTMKGRPKEQLSRWEIEDLMGVRRDTYRRGPGGAFRRR
ncbi:hypothetical protein [Sporosarcina limicola]|uniref:Uncharacterized protein n=1 Tax=Sporosarcina limicola TaxID=34101 RepID=A0A927MI12_9BACL|nr:hypothetical protein [Sporosarcina limicola]MBE1554785.1 hypothetical protein [Sporosarcina limicola]